MGNMQILADVKNLWMKLNVRGVILTSLSLQVFLIFFAPIRKRCSNRWIVMLTWSAYLAADLVADYALGLIAKAQFTGVTSESKADAYGNLSAFWAPFLLLHLGGPDTITAFALEDNELWRRHLLNLLFQLGAAGYVFYQSLPSNKLIVPTILMFIGGTTKYIERTWALYNASFTKFRESSLTFLEARREPGIKLPRDEIDDEVVRNTDDRKLILWAKFLCITFNGLLADLPVGFWALEHSRKILRSVTPKDFLRIIEAELNFFYEVLYTKAIVVHCSVGYLFRAISIGSVITAFALFYVLNKHGFHEYDIKITYTLLLGAVGLEFVALIMLIFSDWAIAFSSEFDIRWYFLKFLKFKSEDSSFASHILHARWSKSIRQYSLIDSRLRMWPKWIEELLVLFRLREFLRVLESGWVEPYSDHLGKLILNELKRKLDELKQESSPAKYLESIKKMCAARGEWVLEETITKQDDCKDLLPFIRGVDYGESLLMWHIATELCYNTDKSGEDNRKTSKVLSNYMLHLMIKQSDMMSTVAGFGEIRFRCTCVEMDGLLKKYISGGSKMKITKESACESLLSDNTIEKPIDEEEGRIKSVLFEACNLAKELGKFNEAKWKIMSEVWVELLGYAAIHCRPYMHAQQLSQGGELVTLVWLMMAHLGLSEQFQIVADPVKALRKTERAGKR